MDCAAQQIFADYERQRSSTRPRENGNADTKAFSPTSVVAVFHSTVRGVRQWAQSHIPFCARCSAKSAQGIARSGNLSIPYNNNRGTPSLKDISDKKLYRVTSRVLQRPSLTQLETTQELFFPLLLWEADLQFLTDSSTEKDEAFTSDAEWIKKLENWCNNCLLQSLKSAKKTAECTFQERSQGADSPIFSTVELFLHTLSAQAVLTLNSKREGNRTNAHHDPYHFDSCSSACRFANIHMCITFATPVHISALVPFMEIVRNTSTRATLLTEIIEPTLNGFIKYLWPRQDLSRFISKGIKQAIILWDAVDIISECSTTASRFAFFMRLFHVLRVLSLAKTTFEMDIGFPTMKNGTIVKGEVAQVFHPSESRVPAQQELSGVIKACAIIPGGKLKSTFQTFALKGLSSSLWYLRSLLHCFSPPSLSSIFPEFPDRDKMELALAVRNVPRQFVAILLKEFPGTWSSVSESSSLQSSVLNFLVSPQDQVTFGLRWFSELCIDVYRPFHPCTGISVTTTNSSTLTSCTPTIQLKESVLEANLRIAEAWFTLSKILNEIEKELPAASKSLEKCIQDGDKTGKKINEWATEHENFNRLKEQYTALSIKSINWTSSTCKIILPLHQSVEEAPKHSRSDPLLYGFFSVEKLN